jgi:hypothetical protein
MELARFHTWHYHPRTRLASYPHNAGGREDSFLAEEESWRYIELNGDLQDYIQFAAVTAMGTRGILEMDERVVTGLATKWWGIGCLSNCGFGSKRDE